MPDREKVIKGLEELQVWLKRLQTVGFHGDMPEYRERELTVSDALALLREQEPVEPERSFLVPDMYYCGNCGAEMLNTGDGYRPDFCPYCGKAVKWNA